jgi:hypothetical protein
MNELVPSEFFVSQNYPNPFKERTKIKYCVAYKTRVQITIYNSEGEESAYSYRLEAGDYKNEKKMQLIK